MAHAALTDDFDPPNSNVTATQAGSSPGPTVVAGGPTGQYLRLINDGVNNQRNRYSYDRTDAGWYSTLTAQFDFAGYSADQAADGFSLAILPTSLYGTSGSGPNLSEAPNAWGVFGLGFWVYPATNNNRLSVHWDNREIVRYTVDPAKVDFDNGTWNRAQLTIQSIGPGGNVKLDLIGDVHGTPQTVTVCDKYFFGPSGFENRIQFSGRTGGSNMDVNLDNIQVTYANPIAPLSTISPPANTLVQDFDSLGTTYFVANQYNSYPGPQVRSGGSSGKVRRLVQQTNSQTNQIAFDRVASGLYNRIEAEWDFAILAGADGGAFALLNTGWEGITGPVSNPSPAWEEPRFANGFAIGFDVYPNLSDISLNWAGQQVAEVGTYDYRGATLRHANAVIEFVTGGANVSLSIDGTPIYTNHLIPGMTPFESRVAFGARTGGANTNFDLDNIQVRWLNPIPQPTDPFHWRGPTGDYNTAANWTNNILPTGNDDAVINVGVATGTVNLQGTGSLTVTDHGGLNAGSLQVAGAAGTQGNLVIDGNAVVYSAGDFYVANGVGASGLATIRGNARLTVNGTHTVIGRDGLGRMVQEGGTVSLRRLFVAEFGGSAGSQYTLSGGTLNLSDRLEVGRSKAATFTQTGGTVNAANVLYLGEFDDGDPAADAVYEISGGTLNIGATAQIGRNAKARFIQTGGAVNVASDLYVANEESNRGTAGVPTDSLYEIHGGTLTVSGVHTVVGRGARGHFLQDGTSTVNLKRLFLAEFSGSDGSTYTLNNGTLTLSQRMEVGRSAPATFIQTGGTVNALSIEAAPDDYSILIGRGSLAGVYRLQGGQLNVAVLRKGSAGQFDFTGGRLSAGAIQFDLLNAGGTLAPGTSPGLTTIAGNYTQNAAGAYEVELAGYTPGTEHDLVHVTGLADLDGYLDVLLVDPFRPILGDTFDVLIADQGILDRGLELRYDHPYSGGFVYNILGANGGSQILQLTYVPEPTSWMILGLCGLVCLGWLLKGRVKR